jgi:hypothetical protein
MAEKGNATMVEDFDTIMKSTEVRLSKGMVGTMQASAMAMLKARRKPDGHGIYTGQRHS